MRRTSCTLFVGAAVTLLVLLAGPGQAAAQSCLIELGGTTGEVRFDGLAPGDRRAWWTSVRNASDDTVDLELQLRGTGLLAEALDVIVDRCDVPWSGAPGDAITCAEPHVQLLAVGADPAAGPHLLDLGALTAGEVVHLRATATMRSSAGDAYQGAAGAVRTTFTAAGDGTVCAVPTGPPVDEPEPRETGDPGPPSTIPAGPQDPDRDLRAPERPGHEDAPSSGTPVDRRRPRVPLAVTGAQVGTLALGSLGTVAAGLALLRRRPGRGARRGPPPGR